jgi:hypothetical protein
MDKKGKPSMQQSQQPPKRSPRLQAASNPRPRRLPNVVALRDISDVERLVTSTLERLSLPVHGADSDRLVLAGVEAVFRVDRSVPREHPLGPVVDGMLEQNLLELHRLEATSPATELKVA